MQALFFARKAGRTRGYLRRGSFWSVVEGGVDKVNIFLAQAVLGQPQTFANTINMK